MRNLQIEKKVFEVHDLGLIDYAAAYQEQKSQVDRVLAGGEQALILCEHPTVLTMGRLASEENLLKPIEEINNQGVTLQRIDRGGEVTLHSQGQIVAYPIFNLNNYGKDLKLYLHKLEQVIIEFLAEFDIFAKRIPGQRGVWVGDKKIASIGIGVKKWISFHGSAININTDLSLYSMIKPCGLDVTMTSVKEITGRNVDMRTIKIGLIQLFEKVFNLENSNERS